MNKKIYIHQLQTNNINLNSIFPVYINNKDIINNIEPPEYAENRYLRSQYYLEIYLHKIISQYDNLTNDVNNADIVYIPIYLFLLAWIKKPFYYDVNNIILHLKTLELIIENYVSSGKIIIMCYSDVMWEDSRCFINYFKFHKNVYFICYENVLDKYCNNQISVPFITHIKCNPEKYNIEYIENKENLIGYAGRDRKELKYFKNLKILDTNTYQEINNQWISYNDQTLYDNIDNLYNKCFFSLQPHGDKQTRKGFYHSLLLGCIPVVFENNKSVYNSIFKKLVDINDICIVIKNEQINNIEEILEDIVNKQIIIPFMIENIKKIKYLLLYPDVNNELINYIIEHVYN
jgi:hypothetical protein